MQEEQRNAKSLGELTDEACELVLVRHGETPWNIEHRLQVVAARRPPPAARRPLLPLPCFFSFARQPWNLYSHSHDASVPIPCHAGAAGAWPAPHPARMAAGEQAASRNRRRCHCCQCRCRCPMAQPHNTHNRIMCMDVQAEVLAESLQRERFDAIYSSDLLRAVQTAEAVVVAWDACGGAANGSGGSSSSSRSPAVQADPQLRERHLGVLQGLTHAEAAAQQPEAFAALGADGGPSAAQVRRVPCPVLFLGGGAAAGGLTSPQH